MVRWISVLVCTLLVCTASSKRVVKIGGIFARGFEAEVSAFHWALTIQSASSNLLHFKPVVEIVQDINSRTLYNAACNILKDRNIIAALLVVSGDNSGRSIAVVEGLAARAGIPLLLIEWQPPLQFSQTKRPPITFNYYPDAKSTSTAITALLEDFDWKGFTVLYDEDCSGLIQLQKVLETSFHAAITIRKLEHGGDNRPLLKKIHESGETKILLNCEAYRVKGYLEQARDVKMFGEYHTYLLSSLNAHTMEMPHTSYIRSNVTSIRAIVSEQPRLQKELSKWKDNAEFYRDAIPLATNLTQLETVLVLDAVHHVTTALTKKCSLPTKAANCLSLESVMDYPDNPLSKQLLETRINGFTGDVFFKVGSDNVIHRTDVSFDFLELTNNGFNKTAEWDGKKSKLVLTLTERQKQSLEHEWSEKKTYRVASRVGPPYLMLRKEREGEQLVGNERYEGYVPDLMKLLEKDLGITYEIELVEEYEKYDSKTKKWKGLIGKLLAREADLAICDLSITSDRRRVVDFTSPFMNLGISILYRNPKKQPPDPFSFLKPFSFEVWMYVATAYLAVSIMLFIAARISPADWENSHPCVKATEELENIWHIKNCTWLTMGSIMTQGSDILPKAVGSRWITGMWWFFTLIMTSSYTANMAAFLTKEQMYEPIKNAKDLAKQTDIKYGAVRDGATANFFMYSNNTVYKRMWEAMQSDPTVFMANNDEASKRVLRSKSSFAFLMESSYIDYMVQRHCDLTRVGGTLDNKGYGIAMPFNSPYRTKFDNAILKLAESNRLEDLRKSWWENKNFGESCENTTKENPMDASKLGVKNVGGVFLVLGAGAGLACVVAMIEFLWNVRDIAVRKKISQTEALKSELNFSINIFRRMKPVPSHQSSQSRSSRSRPRSRSRAVSIDRATSSYINLDDIY